MRRLAAVSGIVAMVMALFGLALVGPSAGDAERTADASGQARGRIVFTSRFDESAGSYGAGSVPFVQVRNASGDVVAERRASSAGVVIALPRGRYVLAAYWRPCEGPCDPEDLVTDRCAKRVPIRTALRGASETVTASAVFRGGEPCRLRVRSDWPPPVVVRTGRAKLLAARGPFCPPKGCALPAANPTTKRRLPVRAGSRVVLNLKVPTRRLELTGICGSSPLSYAGAGRRWYFGVPRETVSSIRTCGRLKLTATYAGPGPRGGVRAVFGFRLRLAG
ncbi:MAG TPA: hypothetical protein VFQ12_07380 [Thermoleophilaceae bacterium]|nr:hypothetical protein [Thermoleophilaceae bacterium]